MEKVHNIIKVIDRTETIATGNQIIANVKLLKYITGIRRQHETFIMLNAEGITKFRGNSFYINKTWLFSKGINMLNKKVLLKVSCFWY